MIEDLGTDEAGNPRAAIGSRGLRLDIRIHLFGVNKTRCNRSSRLRTAILELSISFIRDCRWPIAIDGQSERAGTMNAGPDNHHHFCSLSGSIDSLTVSLFPIADRHGLLRRETKAA